MRQNAAFFLEPNVQQHDKVNMIKPIDHKHEQDSLLSDFTRKQFQNPICHKTVQSHLLCQEICCNDLQNLGLASMQSLNLHMYIF